MKIRCPGCETVLSVGEENRGKQIRCSSCKRVLKVPREDATGDARSADPDANAVKKTRPTGENTPIAREILPPARRSRTDDVPPAKSRRARDDEDDGEPRALRARDEHEWDDEPASRSRRRRDEDDRDARDKDEWEERSRRERSGKKSALPWILASVGGGTLLVAGVVVAVLYFVAGKPAQVAQVKPPAQNVAPAQPPLQPPVAQPPVAQPPVANPPTLQPPPKQVEVPAGPTPGLIVAETTRKVKNATTYLKVTMGNGDVGQGSGFFAAEPGLVFTNAHVVGMLRPGSLPPSRLDVVVHSGEAGEFTLAGQLLGVDAENDLAVLRVTADPGRLPEPLAVDTTHGLTELQKVYVFGFPLGSTLGKDITVSESSISSLRRSADGTMKEIQVNGGMHPGNSGGPVVDSRGVVVGVAVAVVLGTQLNFAVPGEKVQGLLRGRVRKTEFGLAYIEGARANLPVQIECLDPLRRIRDLRLEVWVGDAGLARPLSLKPPQLLPGDGPRQTVPLKYQGGKAAVDVAVPSLPAGKVLWVQPLLTDGGGVTHWASATMFKLSDAPPIERKPAVLQQKFTSQAERTIKLNSSVKLHLGRSGQFSVSTFADVEALEKARGGAEGGEFLLFPGKTSFIEDFNGKAQPLNPGAQAALGGRMFTFILYPTGRFWRRIVPVSNVSSLEFDELVGLIANPYEMTCLSLPNKEVQPRESWEAKLPLILSNGKTTQQMVIAKGKKKVMVRRGPADIVDMVLTCTYEGRRAYQGENQAVISVTGFVQGRAPGKTAPAGKITGTFHLGLDKGYLTKAALNVRSEGLIVTDDGNDIPIARILDVNLTRVPGNTAGIVAKIPEVPQVPKGATLYQQNLALSATDKTDCPLKPGCSYKKVDVNLVAGKAYVIEMDRTDNSFLDPFLLLVNPKGKVVARDDDSGGNLNARIIFRGVLTGTFSIYATALEPGMHGAFKLTVSERAGTPGSSPTSTPELRKK